jgi:hypothetical protein
MSEHDDLVESWTEEFREAHGQDQRSAAAQSFDEYWDWVKTLLLTGGAGQRGWLGQADEILGRVRDTAASAALRARFHALGKRIAAEWAKPSRHRRIHTTFFQGSPNLQTWGRQLERAASSDSGDGVAIGQALDAIERELGEVLGGR